MRRLAALLGQGSQLYPAEIGKAGSNGNKKLFECGEKVFLRALAKDLGLRDVTASAPAPAASPYPVIAA